MTGQSSGGDETSTIVEERVTTSSNKPESAHYVISPDPAESNHAYVMRARVEGFPVTALCGFQWVPNKQATGLPVCQDCRDIFDALPDDGGGDPRE